MSKNVNELLLGQIPLSWITCLVMLSTNIAAVLLLIELEIYRLLVRNPKHDIVYLNSD